jgi:signal transduction histidine kinase
VRPVDAAIAVAVLAASLALFASIAGSTHGARGLDALTVVLIALSSLPLVARRVFPLPVFVATTLASSALYAVSAAAPPPIGPTLALYWIAAGDERERPKTGVMLAIVGVALAVHVSGPAVRTGKFPGTELLWGVLVWGGAWAVGERARLRRERIAELEERALRNERDAERERQLAAADERTRIARELHDSAGHAINVILVHAGLGRLRAEADDSSGRSEFETIEQIARETVSEIDQLVGALREGPANGQRPVEAPPRFEAIATLVEQHRAAGIDVALRVPKEPPPLSPAADRGAYRILQEALTNAARHGNGSAVVDVVCAEGAIDITVTNPLRPGYVPRTSGGHGVVGMRERATLLGGSLDASAGDGRFEVHARLPLGEAAR